VPFNTAIYAITALILSANGAYSIVVTSNELYHVKEKKIISRRVKSLFLILILISVFLFTIIVLGFGNTIFNFIINNTVFGEKIDKIFPFFLLFKYPVAFLAIFICIKLIYVIAPDLKISSKSVNKGALFTTIGWILTTFIYSYYVSNFANYDRFYGSLAGIIVLFIWTYIIAYIFVIGIAINTNNYHIDQKEVSINKE
jgi:membrane protein